MNYNPYMFMPASFSVPRASGGILSRIFGSGGLKLGSILNGTQRVLNFTNQLIPVVKQVQPMVKNAKTMFKVMNEFKRNDKNNTINNYSYTKNNDFKTSTQNTIGPTFFE